MAESIPFKEYYGLSLAWDMTARITTIYPDFPGDVFVAAVAAEIEPLELKARVKLIARCLRGTLPPHYPDALAILLATLGPELPEDGAVFNQGYHIMPIAQFVEDYGLDHFDESVRALYEITRRFSSEFAIRPYLIRYPAGMLAILHEWTQDPNPHVRRLVSEGTRTRLPWASRLPHFIRDPEPVIALLEKLKRDPSLYVRRSVANNLNDIGKDHPARMLDVLKAWREIDDDRTQWIIKHALRTMVKAGSPEALALLGYAPQHAITAPAFTLSPDRINVGDGVRMALTLHNAADTPEQAVVDYAVHFVKANGSTSPKVFKWTVVELGAGESLTLAKNHFMRVVTTRTMYPGTHRIEVQVNGQIVAGGEFVLSADSPP